MLNLLQKTMLLIYIKKVIKTLSLNNRGNILLFAMIFGTISVTLVATVISGYAISENRASVHKANREQAFQIAEAGANYYRWHLAHNKTDYQDGTNAAGPYLHEYKDKDDNVIGHYSLNITPPPTGSTVVTIESTGWLDTQPNSRRTIRVRVGFLALTDYAFLSNSSVIIGANDVVHGKLHSNGGVEFDGTADALITSAVDTYKCKFKNNRGCSNQQTKNGVWGSGGPTNYWKFPVPAVDIRAIVPQIKTIKDGAKNGGLYLSSSGEEGYRFEFTSDGNINVYKVISTKCYKGKEERDNKKDNWFCDDRNNLGPVTVYPIPANGFIYVSDRVWVDGVVNGRATIAVKEDKPIIIDGNLTYTAKDGSSALGLIAGKDLLISHDAPTNLEIDAVLLANNGDAKQKYFKGSSKTSLTVYGSVITYKSWYWNWVDDHGNLDSGYQTANFTYDSYLTYNPPPGFPFGADYNLISWEEVK